MARSSSPAGLPVIPATPPRLSLLHGSDSDLDELTDERIPATSPFVTQPTQIVSNPRTTLKRPSPPPPVSDISLSSSPPREASKPPTFSKQPTFPRRNQTITSFFKRPLQLSPKMGAAEPARRSSSAPKPMIPQKRESDIVILSDDDDEDELAGDRADIQPTYFSRTVSCSCSNPRVPLLANSVFSPSPRLRIPSPAKGPQRRSSTLTISDTTAR